MKNQRIILLPGFSEDAYVFDKIKHSLLDYNLVFVDYRETLNQSSLIGIDLFEFAKKLIKNYAIIESDLLIGHSMGGYFAFAIRELISSEICMIASFSNSNKVKRITKNKFITILVARSGFIKSNFVQGLMKKPTIGKYHEKAFNEVMINMKKFSNSQLAKMASLSFGKKIETKKENPLRIHAKNDQVVSVPDEEFFEVQNGHFGLVIDEKEILTPIMKWLKENKH